MEIHQSFFENVPNDKITHYAPELDCLRYLIPDQFKRFHLYLNSEAVNFGWERELSLDEVVDFCEKMQPGYIASRHKFGSKSEQVILDFCEIYRLCKDGLRYRITLEQAEEKQKQS